MVELDRLDCALDQLGENSVQEMDMSLQPFWPLFCCSFDISTFSCMPTRLWGKGAAIDNKSKQAAPEGAAGEEENLHVYASSTCHSCIIAILLHLERS